MSSTDGFLLVVLVVPALAVSCCWMITSALDSSANCPNEISPMLVVIFSYFSKIFTLIATYSIYSYGMFISTLLLEELNSIFFYRILSTPIIDFLLLKLQLYLSISFSLSIFISRKG